MESSANENRDGSLNASSSDIGAAQLSDTTPVTEQPKKPEKKVYKKLEFQTPEQIASEDMMNNCGVRTVLSGAMGAVMGPVFGLFMQAMNMGGGAMDGAVAQPNQTTRQVLKEMYNTTKVRSLSYAKGFGTVGALFAGSECVIEKMRAKHDVYNSVYAGCVTGGTIAHSGGAKAMCVGCVSFAAFSAVIDRFMGQH